MRYFFIIVLFFLQIVPIKAGKLDLEKPISINSDKMYFDNAKQLYILDGSVSLIKGTMIITGDYAEVVTTSMGYQIFTIKSKKLSSFKKKRETHLPLIIEGYAQIIEYNTNTGQIKLINNAKIYQTNHAKIIDKITGDYITYNFYTERFSAISKKNSTIKSIFSIQKSEY